MSMNLHNIVRGAITVNKDDEAFTLIRSVGKQVINSVSVESYVEVPGFKGQWQSEGDAALNFANMAAQNTITRRLYLYADSDRQTRAWSIYRPLARSGDYVVNSHGEWWQVTAVVEDFSDVGWEQLRVTFQQVKPKLNIIPEGESE